MKHLILMARETPDPYGETAEAPATEQPGEEVQSQTTEEPVFEIEGENVKLSQIKQWREAEKNRDKWQSSNTVKAQEIADQQRYLQKAKMLEDYLNNNPDKYSEIEQIIKGERQRADAAGEEVSLENIQKQVLEMRKMVEEERKSRTDKEAEIQFGRKIDADISDIKTKYPQFFKDNPKLGFEIAEHCLKTQNFNIESAFRDMMFDKASEFGANTMTERAQQGKDNLKKLGMPSGKAGTGSVKSDVRGMSNKDIMKKIMADPRFKD